MALRFNYDNGRMLIANWSLGAGGEFLIRCISISKHMVLLGSTDQVRRQLNYPSDYDFKVSVFRGQHRIPGVKDEWHKHFIISNQWLAALGQHNPEISVEGQFNERVFVDSHLASREFYDRFWRPISCDVSHAGLGFGFKTHCLDEVLGLKNLMPNAKLLVAENSEIWQRSRGRLNDEVMFGLNLYAPVLGPMPPELGGVRVNVDDMMFNESSFMQQMETAYRMLSLDDFKQCRDHVREMRKIYLSWHVKDDL